MNVDSLENMYSSMSIDQKLTIYNEVYQKKYIDTPSMLKLRYLIFHKRNIRFGALSVIRRIQEETSFLSHEQHPDINEFITFQQDDAVDSIPVLKKYQLILKYTSELKKSPLDESKGSKSEEQYKHLSFMDKKRIYLLMLVDYTEYSLSLEETEIALYSAIEFYLLYAQHPVNDIIRQALRDELKEKALDKVTKHVVTYHFQVSKWYKNNEKMDRKLFGNLLDIRYSFGVQSAMQREHLPVSNRNPRDKEVFFAYRDRFKRNLQKVIDKNYETKKEFIEEFMERWNWQSIEQPTKLASTYNYKKEDLFLFQDMGLPIYEILSTGDSFDERMHNILHQLLHPKSIESRRYKEMRHLLEEFFAYLIRTINKNENSLDELRETIHNLTK